MEFQTSAAGQAGSGKRHRLHSLMFCKPTQSLPPTTPVASLYPTLQGKSLKLLKRVETEFEANHVRRSGRTSHSGTHTSLVLCFWEGHIATRPHAAERGSLSWLPLGVTGSVAGNSHDWSMVRERCQWQALGVAGVGKNTGFMILSGFNL